MYKKLKLLMIIGFALATHAFAQDNTDRAILLKGVGAIPMPNQPAVLSAITVTAATGVTVVNDLPQVIAKAKNANGNALLNVIVTARLQKGRIIVFGSSTFWQKPLSDNKNLSQLIDNTLTWADQKNLKTVQIWGDSTISPMLGDKGYRVIATGKHVVDKTSGIIMIMGGIKDTTELSPLEGFIRNGGTLILCTPFFNKANYLDMGINPLLLKVGLKLVFDTATINNNPTLTTTNIASSFPIDTILKVLEGHNYKQWTDGEWQNVIDGVQLALMVNPPNSPVAIRIKNLFDPPGTPVIIPTERMPVSKKDRYTYTTYLVKRMIDSKQADENYIDPASKDFPGAVADTAARINTRISIPVQVGNAGVWEPTPLFYRWHSTGLYVPAGESVRITIDAKDTIQHLKAQVGVHNDDLWITDADYFTRTPYDLTSTFELVKGTTTVHSAYGGILMIKIPDTCTLKNISISVNGAVKYPYFKLGTTSLADWQNSIRYYGAPWAEIASDKIILTVPANRIRLLEDPEKVLKFWDEVLDTDAKLAALQPQRKHPERIIADRQLFPGAGMFATEYKVMIYDGEPVMQMLDEHGMRTKGSWGHFHELGHRHQFVAFDFDGTTEVTVNLFTMYIYDKLLHQGIYGANETTPDRQALNEKVRLYMAAGTPSFEKWKDDPFLALCMYLEIVDDFGWGPIEQVYKNYRAIPPSQYPKTDADKRDIWFVQISKATHRNLTAFFKKWQIPITDKAIKQVSQYPEWLPDELKN